MVININKILNWCLITLTLTLVFTHQLLNATDVKILLDSSKTQSPIWQFSSPGELFIGVPKQPATRQRIAKAQSLTVKIKYHQIYLNDQPWPHASLYILPSAQQAVHFADQPYHGLFLITKHQNDFALINYVDLEDYICSVLKTECWPTWPDEVYRVCAVASRSYIIAKILENRHSKQPLPYHASSTNKHQTYSGKHDDPRLRRIVDETRGLIIGHNKQPVLAMFDCCCGGIIPAHMSEVNFSAAPYLKRAYPCHYCRSWKHHEWQAKLNIKKFKAVLKAKLPKIRGIDHITIKKDRAGLVKQVIIKDGSTVHKFKGKLLYRLFKEIKSFCFTLTKAGQDIIVAGKGYGHHLGVCQWGAKQMVAEGWNYRDILKFYFPNTHFMRIKAQASEIS